MGSLLLLRLLHVVTGIMWGGTAMFSAWFVIPSVIEAGPAGGVFMNGMLRRRFNTIIPAVALVTVLSGMWLMWRVSGGDMATWSRTWPGHILSVAGGLAIIAWLVGFFVSRPAGQALAALAPRLQAATDPAERERLLAEMRPHQQRSFAAVKVIAWLVLLASIGMAVARYL